MTLVLLLAAFLAIVLLLGLLVAVHDALETAWLRVAGGGVGAASAGPEHRREPRAATAPRVRPLGGVRAAARGTAPSAAPPTGIWRHLH